MVELVQYVSPSITHKLNGRTTVATIMHQKCTKSELQQCRFPRPFIFPHVKDISIRPHSMKILYNVDICGRLVIIVLSNPGPSGIY